MSYKICVIALTVFLLIELVVAVIDKSAYRFQLGSRDQHFLTFTENAGNWSDFVLNFALAYILAYHASSWRLDYFVALYVGVCLAGIVGFLRPLLHDSVTNPSAFFQAGKATTAGTMHQIYWTGGMTTAIGFYVLTPHSNVTWKEVVPISLLFMAHLVVSIMQPPYKMHGKVHAPARFAALGGCGAVLGLTIYLLT